MKTIYFGVLISLFSIVIYGQEVNFEWAKSMGGTNYDYGKSITTDAFGNIYVTGSFKGMVDFDPSGATFNLISKGGTDVFVQKIDVNGNFIWAKSMGGILDETGTSITADASGNIYVSGYFEGTVDFDSSEEVLTLTSNGATDGFIQKIDTEGNLLWVRSMGGTSGIGDQALSVAVDTSENVYITGTYLGTVDFDPSDEVFNLTANGYDIFIQKLDSNGHFVWAKSMGSTGWDFGIAITVDAFEKIYVTGFFQGTVDFDPNGAIYNLTSLSGQKNFIQKLDANGNLIWAKSTEGMYTAIGNSIITDFSGNVYVTGLFKNTVDFDPSSLVFNLTSNGNNDVFIQKIDIDGNFIWAKSIGGASRDEGTSITVDVAGNVYVTGFFQGTVDFDPSDLVFNLTSSGSTNIFIQKIDTNGDFIWAKSMGGETVCQGFGIATDAMNNLYVTGSYKNTVDFNPGEMIFNLTSNGITDIFIQKLSQCTSNEGVDIVNACEAYSWINGLTYIVSNDTATFNIINGAANGCDSLVTLNLTIGIVDITVITEGFNITANTTGATYQWLDCDNEYAVIEGEIGQSFTASQNGNYAVEIIENDCIAISACTAILIEDTKENHLFKNISIFPNPTQGSVNINLGDLKETSIKVFNLRGQLIYNKENIHTSTHQFELKAADGIYFIEISAQGQKRYYKLVKTM